MGYTDMLADFGIGSAHPGGFSKSKQMIMEMDLDEDKVVLDCGCGTGQTSAYIKQIYDCSVVAIEQHPVMFAKARNRFLTNQIDITLLSEPIEAMSVKDSSIDVVLAESVLSFLQLDIAISQIKRVLKPGGTMYANELICTQSLTEQERRDLKQTYGFNTLFTSAEWETYLKNQGLKNISISDETSAYQLQMDETDKGNDMIPSPTIDPTRFTELNLHQEMMKRYEQHIGHAIITAVKQA